MTIGTLKKYLDNIPDDMKIRFLSTTNGEKDYCYITVSNEKDSLVLVATYSDVEVNGNSTIDKERQEFIDLYINNRNEFDDYYTKRQEYFEAKSNIFEKYLTTVKG